jgi:hypothetical protein
MMAVVPRILAMWLVLVALVAGLVTNALATSTAGAPITKAEAVAFGRSVNLTPSDLPGAKKAEYRSDEPTEHDSLSKIVRCARPGMATHRSIGEVDSILFDTSEVVGSLVRVMPTAAMAAADLAAFGSRRGHACFARAAQLQVANEPPPPPDPFRAVFIPLVKLLGAGAIGVHTLSRPFAPSSSAGSHADVVLFRVGPAEVTFLTVSAHRQFPSATEGRLLAMLHSRAEAHKL